MVPKISVAILSIHEFTIKINNKALWKKDVQFLNLTEIDN
jgi:hypothetical protein